MKLKLVQQINTVASSPHKSSVIEKYPIVFIDELGSLPGTCIIKLNPNTGLDFILVRTVWIAYMVVTTRMTWRPIRCS